MQDVKGDLWRYPADWLCITTNGVVKKNGQAVMGRGCARQARDRYLGLDLRLGTLIEKDGNHVHYLGKEGSRHLFSFPVKHRWNEAADLDLIRRSCQELRALWLTRKDPNTVVVIPRPGCGNGQLDYRDVRPVLMEELPEDAFHIITF